MKSSLLNVFRVWSIQTCEMVNTLIHHCEAVLHLRFSDGIMVTCSKVSSLEDDSCNNTDTQDSVYIAVIVTYSLQELTQCIW